MAKDDEDPLTTVDLTEAIARYLNPLVCPWSAHAADKRAYSRTHAHSDTFRHIPHARFWQSDEYRSDVCPADIMIRFPRYSVVDKSAHAVILTQVCVPCLCACARACL